MHRRIQPVVRCWFAFGHQLDVSLGFGNANSPLITRCTLVELLTFHDLAPDAANEYHLGFETPGTY